MNNDRFEVTLDLTNQKVQFTGVSKSNPDRPIVFDYLPPLGDGQGYRGLELLLMSFTGCVGTSIVYLLRNMGKDISQFKINAQGIKREQPLSIQKICLEVIVESKDVQDSDMQSAIERAEKLSPVWTMLKNNVEVIIDYKLNPNKMTSAICGLFCPSCTLFIATSEDSERLKKLAVILNQTVEESLCEGCRSKTKTNYCKECKMAKCASEKGIEFCGECKEYPCDELKTFQALKPHRIDLWQSQQRIKEVGYEQWYNEMAEHYACPVCHTINSAYDMACRKCGNTPSCSYVKINKEAILDHLSIIRS